MKSLCLAAVLILGFESSASAGPGNVPPKAAASEDLVDLLPAVQVLELMTYDIAVLEQFAGALGQSPTDPKAREFKLQVEELGAAIRNAYATAKGLPATRATVLARLSEADSRLETLAGFIDPFLDEWFDMRGQEHLFVIVPDLRKSSAAVRRKLAAP